MDKVFINELKQVISSIVREELQNYMITEVAMSLKDYKSRVEALMQQILENWCLIRYSTLTGEKENLKSHWKSELKAHANNIASIKLKNGNSSTSKQNALYSLWNMYDWDTDENCIARRMYAKFEEEDIPIDNLTFIQIATDFKNETKNIVKMLTSKSNIEIMEYINNI